MRPLIGVTSLYDIDKDCGWMWKNYLNFIIAGGAMPMVLPLNNSDEVIESAMAHCDGFLFTGGEDVDVSLYHSTHPERCNKPARELDAFEMKLFKGAWDKKKPMFGICRGAQLINVALGGTLIEDIPSMLDSHTEHRTIRPHPPSIHRVTITSPSPLAKITGKTTLEVNSYHHQCINELGKGLEVIARATDDQIIEAIWAPDYESWLMALQWHPERIYETHGENLAILQSFIQATRRRVNR